MRDLQFKRFQMLKDESQESFLKKFKINILIVLLVLLIFLTLFTTSCNTPTEPIDQIVIPTNEVTGPGGPAYLYGFIKDYVHPSKSVSNTHIYIMNQQDYTDTVIHVFVNSTDASFIITNMPEGVFDIIFMNNNYLCNKLGKITMKPLGNSFYNPNSGGYFIDSTIYITNIADSVGRPDAPEIGLQGYDAGIVVYFKSETDDTLAWSIIQSSSCDTLAVYRYNDPVFDPFENDVYVLNCTNRNIIANELRQFNWMKEIKRSGPLYLEIQH